MALTKRVALQCVVIEFLSSPFGLGLHLRPYLDGLGAALLFLVEIGLSLNLDGAISLWSARMDPARGDVPARTGTCETFVNLPWGAT